MLELADPPTAVFAGNNMIAVGVLATLRRRNALRKVAVVGFDDLDLAAVVDPPLTVIDQDPESDRPGGRAGGVRLAGRGRTDQGRGGTGAADRARFRRDLGPVRRSVRSRRHQP